MAIVRYTREKIQEVQDASCRLGLASELNEWSPEDVQKWILWAIREFYSQCLDLLEVDGKELVSLNLAEFERRVPHLHIFFYNELQIWKRATQEETTAAITSQCEDDEKHHLRLQNDNTQHLGQSPIVSNSPPLTKTKQIVSESYVNNTPLTPDDDKNIPRTIFEIKDDDDIEHDNIDSAVGQDTKNTPETSERKHETCKINDDLVSPHTLIPINFNASSFTPTPLLSGSNPFFGNPTPQLTPTFSLPQTPSDMLFTSKHQNPFATTAATSQAGIMSPVPTFSLPQTPSDMLYSTNHQNMFATTTATSQAGLISPMSPHILGPRLMIPPPLGFSLPYQMSPSLISTSPFNSPGLSPNIRSPQFNSHPRMEALKENIKRLEKERKIQASLLNHKSEVATKTRKKKLKKLKSFETPTSAIKSGPSSASSESLSNVSSAHSSGLKPSIPLTSPNAATIIPTVNTIKEENHDSGLPFGIFTDKNSNTMLYPYKMPPYNGLKMSHPLDPMMVQSKTNQNITFEKTLYHKKDEDSHAIHRSNLGYINIEPEQTSHVNLTGTSSVAVRQNSCDIPYYQATSLKALERNMSSSNLVMSELPAMSFAPDISPNSNMQTVHHQNAKTLNVSSSTSPRVNSVRDSYSPISSPSDTEVDLPTSIKYQSQYYHVQHSYAGSDLQHNDVSWSPTDQDTHGEIVSNLLPSVVPTNDSVNFESCSNSPSKCKTGRKRGRPPGSKLLARPLGPMDIQKSFFRANHLWKFLLEMLEEPGEYSTCIQWLDRPNGVFKILDSAYVASLWGKRKNNGRMTYDKFSRSIRQYYKKGIIFKTKASKLIYKFGSDYFNPNGE